MGAAVVLIALGGHGLGTMIGRKVRHAVRIKPLHAVDRLIGGVVSVVVAALVMSMLAFSISSLGVPFVSQQLAESRVIRYIDNVTPTPVKSTMAQLRSTVIGDGIPKLIEGVGPPVTPVPVPTSPQTLQPSTRPPILSSRSPAPHSNAGRTRPVPDSLSRPGASSPMRMLWRACRSRLWKFPTAVRCRVGWCTSTPSGTSPSWPWMGCSPIRFPLSADLAAGSPAAFAGYPHGGPFQSKPATIQGISTILVPDIYGNNPSPELVYRLAGDVQPGNSGGPLLTMQGQVAG